MGDDEHGWSDNGVFNFEGGCYAKLIRLSEEDEPAIYATTKMPGSILENVVLNADGTPDFDNGSLTQNTRGSYPIEYIENRTPDSMAGNPKNVVFLTCDAFGVLPPLSKLSPEQAAYHFMSGYTAKVADNYFETVSDITIINLKIYYLRLLMLVKDNYDKNKSCVPWNGMHDEAVKKIMKIIEKKS